MIQDTLSVLRTPCKEASLFQRVCVTHRTWFTPSDSLFLSTRILSTLSIYFLCFLGMYTSGFLPQAFAQTDIFVQGSGKKYPIAIPVLCAPQGAHSGAENLPRAVSKNLSSSGFFHVIDPKAFIESPGKCLESPTAFAFSDWSVIGAEGLVRGTLQEVGGRLTLQMYLFDVQRQKIAFGKEYEGSFAQLSEIADRFSNEIVQYFTGKSGVFGSKIVFASRVGRFKELFRMNIDGGEVRQLTDERGLTIAPAFHPNGQQILYTSYQKRIPELFLYDFDRDQSRPITSGRELEIGGSFSPDGKSLITAVSLGKQSHIVLMRPDGTPVRKLTSQYGVIDVSPKWSPDGERIVFCSNRSGGPQIYVMNKDGGDVQRVSFTNANYCTSPDWSPTGDRIAYVCRSDGGYNIFTSQPDGTDPLQLTSSHFNEDPEWSPNGEEIAFSTTYGRTGSYNIAIMRADGTGFRLLSDSRTDDTDPAWGPVPFS
ncbi:hypothetical protein EBR25_00485 [bacterium]|nr:hypothetical protein [bacterium]